MNRILVLRILSIALLSVGVAATAGCGNFDSGLGFTVAKHEALNIGVSNPDPHSNEPYVGIRHKKRPECLFGTVLPFLDITPEKYFENIRHETSVDGKIPFLEKAPKIEKQGSLLFASVSSYDETAKKYIPSYVGAFRTRGKLWIAWIQIKCPEPEYAGLARTVITSLRPNR